MVLSPCELSPWKFWNTLPLDAHSNKLLASKLSLVTTRNSVLLYTNLLPTLWISKLGTEQTRWVTDTCIFVCGAGHSVGPFKGGSFGFRIYLIILWMILSHFISCWNSHYVNCLIWSFNFPFSLIFHLFVVVLFPELSTSSSPTEFFISSTVFIHMSHLFGFLNAPLKQKKSSILCGDLFLNGKEIQGKRGYMYKCGWLTLLYSRNTTL